MARPRKTIDLMQAQRRVHRSDEEKAARKAGEINAPADCICSPSYLNEEQREEFLNISEQLVKLGIMSNLDCDTLARYLTARDNYIKFTGIVDGIAAEPENIIMIDKATAVQDRAFKQCRSAASDLGLTVGARCKLVIPVKEERKDANAGLFGDTG